MLELVATYTDSPPPEATDIGTALTANTGADIGVIIVWGILFAIFGLLLIHAATKGRDES